jgi:hypothetical protein
MVSSATDIVLSKANTHISAEFESEVKIFLPEVVGVGHRLVSFFRAQLLSGQELRHLVGKHLSILLFDAHNFIRFA